MRMLDNLREVLDDISYERDHQFVESLLIEEDEGRDFSVNKLMQKQFNVLVRIYDRW